VIIFENVNFKYKDPKVFLRSSPDGDYELKVRRSALPFTSTLSPRRRLVVRQLSSPYDYAVACMLVEVANMKPASTLSNVALLPVQCPPSDVCSGAFESLSSTPAMVDGYMYIHCPATFRLRCLGGPDGVGRDCCLPSGSGI